MNDKVENNTTTKTPIDKKPVKLKRGTRSLTGKPLDTIELNPQIKDSRVNEQSPNDVALSYTEALEEVLSIEQRRKRAIIMRRYAVKVARAHELAKKKLAPTEKLEVRALTKARSIVRKRVAGRRGEEYNSLSASEKIQIDKLVAKKKSTVLKLARKILPRVRSLEFERLKDYMVHKNEVSPQKEDLMSLDIDSLFEQYNNESPNTNLDNVLEDMYKLTLDRVLTEKESKSLQRRADRSGIEYDILERVFFRGLLHTIGDHAAAFDRVNSFINGGRTAMNEDKDLYSKIRIQNINDIFESKNTPYVKPIKTVSTNDKQMGWKASNKHGKVKYFGSDFKTSANKHAGINSAFESLIEKPLKTVTPDKIRKKIEVMDRSSPNVELAKQTSILRKTIDEDLKDPKDNPCWDGYKPVGTKKKKGKIVPNCVPESVDNLFNSYMSNSVKEDVKAADKEPVIIPAHDNGKGVIIPAKTVMRKSNKRIIKSGDPYSGDNI